MRGKGSYLVNLEFTNNKYLIYYLVDSTRNQISEKDFFLTLMSL